MAKAKSLTCAWANRTRFSSFAAVAAAAILTYQLFAPGFVGLADNGDFPRVAGRFSLCPADGWGTNRFRYFVPKYLANPTCYWDSRVPTSAVLFTASARALSPGPSFSTRTLGGVHSAALMALVGLWPPLLLFCDLANTLYFNSFFSEGTALISLLGVAVAARSLVRNKSVSAQIGFTAAAIVLICSKLQHAALCLPLALFLIGVMRWRAVLPTAAFLAAAAFLLLETPAEYQRTNLWNSVLISLVPYSASAITDLRLSGEQDTMPFSSQTNRAHSTGPRG